MMTTFSSYQLIARDMQTSLKRTASNPIVARESQYYLENIGNVKSIDDFLGNQRLYAYAMKAFGLEDMTYAKAFMRKVLTEGIDSKDSFVNRLQDERYLQFATTFNFKAYGPATTAFARAQQGTVDNYVRTTLESNAGDEDPGVRLALYFERKASTIKSAYSILADPALLQVVQTTLSLPEGGGDIDAQARTIEKRIDIDSLQDPAYVKRFLQRFTVTWDAQNNTTSSPVLALFSPPSSGGMDVDMLVSLQRIKSGGV